MSSSSNPVTLLFRTAGDWGAGLGRNLVPAEVDENFYTVQRYINFLHDNPILPAQIESISVSSGSMTFNMTDGTSFGPYTLPSSAFRWTGDFQPVYAYKVFDLLVSSGNLYMVLQDHTSAASFLSGAANSAGPLYRLLLPSQTIYDIGFFFPGDVGFGIGVGNAMFTLRFDRDVYLPQDAVGSVGGTGTTVTADCTYQIYKNATNVGSFTITAGNTVGNFTLPAHVQFQPGDRLRVFRATTIDDTAQDLSMTFLAYKGLFDPTSSS